jgi:hypothetical protein
VYCNWCSKTELVSEINNHQSEWEVKNNRQPENYLPICLPAYLFTYLPTCLPTYLPTYLPACLPIYLPTCLPAYLPTHPPACLPTYSPMEPIPPLEAAGHSAFQELLNILQNPKVLYHVYKSPLMIALQNQMNPGAYTNSFHFSKISLNITVPQQKIYLENTYGMLQRKVSKLCACLLQPAKHH